MPKLSDDADFVADRNMTTTPVRSTLLTASLIHGHRNAPATCAGAASKCPPAAHEHGKVHHRKFLQISPNTNVSMPAHIFRARTWNTFLKQKVHVQERAHDI